jgi:hypothetical protein
MSGTEDMVMNHTYSYDVINIQLTPDEMDRWREIAARRLAEEILANGCLIHSSNYDIKGNYTMETFHVVVGQRKRTLP